ncbi:MAG: hypothetical protein ACXVYV_00170 [Gaiellales bacterium]
MSRREHDAVREARDALVFLGAVTLPVAALAIAGGMALSELSASLRWLVGPLLVGLMLLTTLACALLVADRVSHRYLRMRPHAIGRLPLIAIAIGSGILLVAGLPTTWPVVIGFGLVCAVLLGLVGLGAALDL